MIRINLLGRERQVKKKAIALASSWGVRGPSVVASAPNSVR